LFTIHITGSYHLDYRTIPSQRMPELHYIHVDNVSPYRILKFCFDYKEEGQSQGPRGLTRRSAAARLQGLRIRIQPGAWISVVSVVCCQVEVSATSRSHAQRSLTDCSASLCVIYKPRE